MIQSPEAAGLLPFMTLSSACIFCRIVAGEAEASLVYRDEAVTAFMDAHPVAEGHLLVVPNRHAAGLEDLDESEAAPDDLDRRAGWRRRCADRACRATG